MVHPHAVGSSDSSSITSAEAQYKKALEEQAYDKQEISDNLAQVMDLWKKKGNVQQAYMMMMMLVLPDVTKYKGDSLGISAAKMKLGAACSSLVSKIQSEMNTIEQTPNEPKQMSAAKDLIQNVSQLQKLMGSPGSKSWIDSATASQVKSALDKFSKDLGGGNLTPGEVSGKIIEWSFSPTKKFTNGSGETLTGQQQIQGLNKLLTQANNSFNGFSQMQNNQTQFESNLIQQLLSATKGIYQSMVNFSRSAVNNQSAAR